MNPNDHVVIVGGGFSGTLLAVNLVRFGGPRTTLIERAPDRLGRGVAYTAALPTHLLNVRAAGMSAFPDDPTHFARWLAAHDGGAAQAFVPRATYGAYLRETLVEAGRAAGDRLSVLRGAVTRIDRTEGVGGGRGDASVILDDGTAIAAQAVVLAVGNLPPHTPPGLDPDALPADCYLADPWFTDPCARLADDDRVVLVGSGLTAIDMALKLEAGGFRGEIIALSRRGLRPRAHVDGAPSAPGATEVPDAPLSRLLGQMRAHAAAIGWRAAIDALRPVTQRLWAASDARTRARFLRHLRPFWDVHRHRLAPPVAARIDAMVDAGRLRFVAGKIVTAAPEGDGVRLHWRPRHADAPVALTVRRIVNCTGPQGDLTRTAEPLLLDLLAGGAIRPDALRLGIDVDTRSRVIARDGNAQDDLYCIGPMTRGGLWENVAVPDLRRQSWELGRTLANAQWVGGEGL